ncbi:ISNCY family transposase [Alienimonas sp. DA493]|uniref:ISNCY family transposase n=1 Tax=Alienimonas sp. DA493 TaxID=3373605 RepID=UPI003754779C
MRETLRCLGADCPRCGARTRARYDNRRTVATLDGLIRLTLKVRRCRSPDCNKAYRPEAEGSYALPQHEFGLDVIALIGALRYREHLSVPEIALRLNARPALAICERTVTNLLDRYDELLATSLADDVRLRSLTTKQGRVILALDGLQPDVGHEVLWVLRDCLSGEVLLTRSLLSGCERDLAPLLREVAGTLTVPIAGVVSDGQQSIRRAVASALPGVPHQLCQFHYLREAARPIYEADRHAKKELKKRVRGVRPLERALEARDDAEAEAARGYCAAVRSAITDDGRPPLAASGLKLHGRLTEVSESLARVEQKKGLPPELTKLKRLVDKGLRETAPLWPDVRRAFAWVHRAAEILNADDGSAGPAGADAVRRRLGGLTGAMRRHRSRAGRLIPAVDYFLKVTRSYWPGLFHAYSTPDLPRTNNDLKQLFGSYRWHERRIAGRKTASPALVERGSVRLPAALATGRRAYASADLAPIDVAAWRRLRTELNARRETRRRRTRFRRDPRAFLARLERDLLQPALPA